MNILDGINSLAENKTFLETCGQKAIAWGITVGADNRSALNTRILRVSLIPREFKKSLFEKVIAASSLFHRLIDRISVDLEWLHEVHKGPV